MKQWDYNKTHKPFKRELLVLQIAATFITSCGSSFSTKPSNIYYKIWQPLRNWTALLQNTAAIAKQGIYCKTGCNKTNLEQFYCLE